MNPRAGRAGGNQVGRFLVRYVRDNIRASCSAPRFRTISIGLSLAFSSVPTGTPTTFGDADANAFKKGDLFRRRYVPLRGHSNRFARVDLNADVGQLTLEEGYNFHSTGCDLHYSDANII